jgi:hypothetical protein
VKPNAFDPIPDYFRLGDHPGVVSCETPQNPAQPLASSPASEADRRERLEFIIRGDVGPHATLWMEDHNWIRMPVRCLCVPEGMSPEEARLVVEGKCHWKTDLL